MNMLQNNKVYTILAPTTETAAGVLTGKPIDVAGADTCKILVFGTSHATDKQPTAISVTEGDTTSSLSGIVAFTGGTATNTSVAFTCPAGPGATSTIPYAVFNVDTRARKRYLSVSVTVGTTGTWGAVAVLGRQEQAPSGTATNQENASVIVNG
jgi:hypothetical protein